MPGSRPSYVDMGFNDETRRLWPCLVIPAAETGVVLPDTSGETSERMRGASKTPMAFVFDDPTAGAAFCPSVLPICKRTGERNVNEFVVETTESVGLLGRSWPAEGLGGAREVG